MQQDQILSPILYRLKHKLKFQNQIIDVHNHGCPLFTTLRSMLIGFELSKRLILTKKFICDGIFIKSFDIQILSTYDK